MKTTKTDKNTQDEAAVAVAITAQKAGANAFMAELHRRTVLATESVPKAPEAAPSDTSKQKKNQK